MKSQYSSQLQGRVGKRDAKRGQEAAHVGVVTHAEMVEIAVTMVVVIVVRR